MYKKNLVVIGFVLALLVSGLSVIGALSDSDAVELPWNTGWIKDGVNSGVTNVSTAFGGDQNIPMLSWSINQIIYHALPRSAYLTGNCGPSNSWRCYGISAASGENIVPGTVSQMATLHLINSYLVGWAYKTDTNKIQGVIYEYSDAGQYLTRHWVDLIDLNKFATMVIGAPSIQIVGGHFRLAVTVTNGGSLPYYQLVYLYRSISTNTTCLNAGSFYRCEVIEDTINPTELGAASLARDDNNVIGIAYTRSGQGLKYAYPHTTVGLWPANCGPVPNSWRCISIYGASGSVGEDPELAFGSTANTRAIVFTYDDSTDPNKLFVAEYVGSGGNCGPDKNLVGTTINTWRCTPVDTLSFVADPSSSLTFDPQDYPVVAYNNALSADTPVNLFLTYPRARAGLIGPGWFRQKIDGGPNTTIKTGAKADLSFDGDGLGLIGYLQEEQTVLPDIKAAWQYYPLYLPAVQSMH